VNQARQSASPEAAQAVRTRTSSSRRPWRSQLGKKLRDHGIAVPGRPYSGFRLARSNATRR
jgi:hypothetical protein